MGYLRGRGVGRLKVVGPREDDTHRTTQRKRCARRQRLHQGELASEGAAERLRDDADPLQRQVECAGELPLRHEVPWVLVETTRFPFGSSHAVATWGSMYAW